jgi:hypothetical protein
MVIDVTAGLVLAAMWRVAEPNEALVISGSEHRIEGWGTPGSCRRR